MKFKLTTANKEYYEEDIADLKELGFTFVQARYNTRLFCRQNEHVDVKFTSLKSFTDFIAKFEKVIVKPGEIIIYDDYVE